MGFSLSPGGAKSAAIGATLGGRRDFRERLSLI